MALGMGALKCLSSVQCCVCPGHCPVFAACLLFHGVASHCRNQKSLKIGELCLREEKGVDGEAGEVAEGRKGDTELSAADEEVTSGLGIFFQFRIGLKAQVFLQCFLQTSNLHPRTCVDGWVSWFSLKYPHSEEPCAGDAWLPMLPGTN